MVGMEAGREQAAGGSTRALTPIIFFNVYE
jgi:hypothetical protein